MSTAFDLPPAARPGQPADTIDTPSLVLDLDAFERNVDRMQRAANRARVKLRPHAKAHKCPDISLAQIKRGAVGICCQKISEAIPFARAGVRDIHISNELAGPAKAAMLAQLALRAHVSVCVDDMAQIDILAKAAEAVGTRFDVFIEINVGQGRCGVTDPAAMLPLVDRITRLHPLSLCGLQAYHGGIQHLRGWQERRAGAARAADRTGAFVARLEAAGARNMVITGGGSGSVEFDLQSGVYTEIQPGSYVFMDADYGANEYLTDERPASTNCEHSLFIASAVMSVAAGDRVVVDAGLKSMAVDSGLPWIWADGARSEKLEYVAANDEHGIIAPRLASRVRDLPALGSRVMLVPGHCDPTLNLYDEIIGVRDGVVECVWPVAARGLSR
ncbi:DSD1 family PLP-dependent enzyme [Cupriavidus sp. H18C2]|uniref:DSD1 family PLP-dependent enzyme n=1 Tax=Cupriavidus sp. H18C2 TaxID=3241602 RepID=UPI003BF84501